MRVSRVCRGLCLQIKDLYLFERGLGGKLEIAHNLCFQLQIHNLHRLRIPFQIQARLSYCSFPFSFFLFALLVGLGLFCAVQ